MIEKLSFILGVDVESLINTSGRLRLGGSTRADRVVPGRFAKAYMADILQFEPKSVSFPEVTEGPPVMQARLRMDDVLRRLEANSRCRASCPGCCRPIQSRTRRTCCASTNWSGISAIAHEF